METQMTLESVKSITLPTVPDYSLHYAEVGLRFLMPPMPACYDNWGWHLWYDKQWESFYVMDDYGNMVPVDPWPHHTDGYTAFLAPEFGTHGVYTMQYETIH
jgi:hypothetical protein